MISEGIIYLIKSTYSPNEYGVRIKSESKTKVRASISGTTSSEFYEAGRSGISVSDMVFTIPRRKYHDEIVVEFKGNRYAAFRTYPVAEDLIELHVETKAGTTNGESNTD